MKVNKLLNLGIIGLSEGNGHPYSWSAIFNGYDAAEMQSCPYPVIPEYLGKQKFPQAAISQAKVKNIWCDDKKIAESVARASLIPNVSHYLEDLVDKVDAILLARDDAENHFKLSKPFLKKGMPIYIDKPLGYSVEAAQELLDTQQYDGQIFSCSALRFDPDMLVTNDQLAAIGAIERVEACAPKSWERYAIHVLDPLCASLLAEAQIEKTSFKRDKGKVCAVYQINGQYPLTINVSEREYSPIQIVIRGKNGHIILKHRDSFRAFKKALEYFIDLIRGNVPPLTNKEILAPIRMLDQNYESISK